MADEEKTGANPVAAGFQFFGPRPVQTENKKFGEKPVPILYVMLTAMADGRWWTASALCDRLAWRMTRSTVRDYLVRCQRRRYVRRVDNPAFKVDMQEVFKAAVARGVILDGRARGRGVWQRQRVAVAGIKGGLSACRYVYGITERGRALLALRQAGWYQASGGRDGGATWQSKTGANMTAPVSELIRFVA